MKKEKRQIYSKPELEVLRINPRQYLLSMSNPDVDLTGAGVDENEAEDNGTEIWS